MKTITALVLALLVIRRAPAAEVVPSAVPETRWHVQVMTDVHDENHGEGFTLEVNSDGTGYVYHWWNRGWKRGKSEKTESTLSSDKNARVYGLASAFIHEFSLTTKRSGNAGKERLAVGITMNGGGVSCRREQIESALKVSAHVSGLVEIVNGVLPEGRRSR